MLEPAASRQLGVPKGLAGSQKATNSYYHLRRQPLFTTLDEARDVLLGSQEEAEPAATEKKKTKKVLWKPWKEGEATWRRHQWALDYKCFVSATPRPCGSNNAGSLRMMWGSIHEPTALLVALNAFHHQASTLSECGMFPAEALLDAEPISEADAEHLTLVRHLRDLGCNLGASPDGLLHHHDRCPEQALEVIEVKNHAPFINVPGQGIGLNDKEPPAEVPAWYIPQMQLEMFCVGPHCRSGVMVRLTASMGAVVMRLERDDALIALMLRQFVDFYTRFVLPAIPPPRNFLNDSEDSGVKLLDGIAASAGRAELVVRVAPHHVQRARPGTVPLLV